MKFDLVIRGGVVVDGMGLARRRADVAIAGGKIAAMGHIAGNHQDARVIDAEGCIVAPGIIDLHTHYDPQLTFDPYATSSCYHGVTTVVAGNCGFSIAPTRADARPYIQAMFAKVEGMGEAALDGVQWDFESFPEYLAARASKLGVNLACYIGHSTLRRYVMGNEGSERDATPSEVKVMAGLVREAMAAGAAGFSSSHVPTQLDGDDRPIPSRFSSREELLALVEAAGQSGGGSISYLPESVIGGLNREDEDLLIELGVRSRVPIVIQGVGGRDKVDAPDAAWGQARAFFDRAASRGAAIFSLLRNHPFDRPIDFDAGTSLYSGVPSWDEIMGLSRDEKLARLRDPEVRDRMRPAVDNPNRDPSVGSTLPPPHWDVTFVDEVTLPEHERFLRRSIRDIAGEHPADAMLDGADLGLYLPGTPYTSVIANEEFQPDRSGGSTILVWPRERLRNDTELSKRQTEKLIRHAQKKGWVMMRGGVQNKVTTANILIRQKGAAEDYSGRFTPSVNDPDGTPKIPGVKCYYGTDPDNPLNPDVKWYQLPDDPDLQASPDNMGAAAPQGVVCRSVRAVTENHCERRLRRHIRDSGGRYEVRSRSRSRSR